MTTPIHLSIQSAAFAATLFTQDSTPAHLHSRKRLRLRARVWLVPGGLQKAQPALIRARVALRVKVSAQVCYFALRKVAT